MSTIRKTLAAIAAMIAMATGLLVGGLGATSAQASSNFANGQDPVVLLHGLWGNGAQWNTFVANLKAAGYTDDQITVVDYNSTTQSNIVTAGIIATTVDQVLARTGASKVDIVGHSMGSLNSRWCIKYDACSGKVDDWVSLGGPNHGSWMANLCMWQVTCQQMAPGSQFLTKLNTGESLPAGVSGTVIWSRNDGMVIPAQSAVLPGLDNIEASWTQHMGLMKDERVFKHALAAIAG